MKKVLLSELFTCDSRYVVEVEYLSRCPITHEYFGFDSLQSALDFTVVIHTLKVVKGTNIIRTDHV